jgi:fibronectin type 3 domain-containing protein
MKKASWLIVAGVTAVMAMAAGPKPAWAGGKIVQWGVHENGQPPGNNFVAVAAGLNHCLGLKDDSSIVAWGDNAYGQCNLPIPNTGFIGVAAGGYIEDYLSVGYHSLAVKNDGSIIAWGANNYGECNVPSPNTAFTAVAATGMPVSFGLKSDGSIVAWGSCQRGECSVSSPNIGFVAIAPGHGWTLGLRSNGSISCWGECPGAPSPNSGFIGIAAGGYYDFVLGLKNTGSIETWGDCSAYYSPCDVPSPNSAFVAVAAGDAHGLGLKADGSVVAWGDHSEGQCNVPEPNTAFVAIAAAGDNSLGIRTAPRVLSFAINNGAAMTSSPTVTLDNTCWGSPTSYMASESADFSGAAWQAYSTTTSFVLSGGNGDKTVYFKAKNDVGDSAVASSTINLVEPPVLQAFTINNDASRTTSRTVTLNSTCANNPYYYRASELADFADADWHPYSASASFTLSAGNGTKTVYFQVENSGGQSGVLSDTITLTVPPVITSFAINNGAATTTSRRVTLNNTCLNEPLEYAASESPDFAGATWQPYSTAPEFVLSSCLPTNTVYLRVRNLGGQSATVSDTIVVVSDPTPAAPTGLTASDGTVCDRVRLNWNAAANAIGYKVFRSTSNTQCPGSYLATTTGTTYDDTSATPNVTYYYSVKAQGECQDSPCSDTDAGYWLGGVPGGVSASDGTLCSEVHVSWNAVTNATGYKLYRSTDSTRCSGTPLVTRTSPYYSDTSAQPGTVYYYSVSATTSCGDGPCSTADTGYTVGGPPGTPANLTASDGTYCNKIHVCWDAVPNATSYKLFWKYSGQPCESPLYSITASDTCYDFASEPGTACSFAVQAVNVCGSSACSAVDSGWALTPAPVAFTASDGTACNQVTLTWAPVQGATGYKVYRSTTTDFCSGTPIATPTTAGYVDASAQPGVYYRYSVVATSSCGESYCTWDGGYAGPPPATTAQASAGTECDAVYVAWSYFEGTTQFKVYRGTSYAECGEQIATTSDNHYRDASAQPGVTYYYSVRGSNACGDGACGGAIAGWVGTVPPAAPTGVSATDGTWCDKIRVCWNAVPGATGYNVFRSTAASGCNASAVVTLTGSSTCYEECEPSIQPGVTYYYSVQATHSTCGNSVCSDVDAGHAISPTTTVVDNGAEGYSETGTGWETGSSSVCQHGADYRYHLTGGAGYAQWTAPNPAPGTEFRVFASFPAVPNRDATFPYMVYHDGGITSVVPGSIMGIPPCVAGQEVWVSLGTYTISNASLEVRRNCPMSGHIPYLVVADAVMWYQCSPSQPIISGRVADGDGAAIPSVQVTCDPGGIVSTTGSDGQYSLTVPNTWSGTVTPSRPGCTFTPASRVYTSVTLDQADQNYTGICKCLPWDFDCDGDVDGKDLATFESCASGPAVAYASGCVKTDSDHDGDADQSDFATFQRCYSGENVPANPNCGN